MSEMGKRIRRLREKKEWTQAYLAFQSGVGLSTISALERGLHDRLTTPQIRKLAIILGVTCGHLVDGEVSEMTAEDKMWQMYAALDQNEKSAINSVIYSKYKKKIDEIEDARYRADIPYAK